MKKFRWWIFGALLGLGVLSAFLLRREGEVLELRYVSTRVGASGQHWVVVRVFNHSGHDFMIQARSEALTAKGWDAIKADDFLVPEGGMGMSNEHLTDRVAAGQSRDLEVPRLAEKGKWRVKVSGFRNWSRVERVIGWWREKVRRKYFPNTDVKASLVFSE